MTGADMVAVKPACSEGSRASCSSSNSAGRNLEEGGNKFHGELQRFTRDQGGQKKNSAEKKTVVLQGIRENPGKSSSEGEKQKIVEKNPGQATESCLEINSQTEVLLNFADLLAGLKQETGNDDLVAADEKVIATETLVSQDEKAIASETLVSQDEKAIASETLVSPDEKVIASETLVSQDEKAIASETLVSQDEESMNEAILLAARSSLMADDEQQLSEEKSETEKPSEISELWKKLKPGSIKQSHERQETAEANKSPEVKKDEGQAAQLLNQEGLISGTQGAYELQGTAEGKKIYAEPRQFHDFQEDVDQGEPLRVKQESSGAEQLSTDKRTNPVQVNAEELSRKTSSNSWLLGLPVPEKNSAARAGLKEEQGLKQKASELVSGQEKNQDALLQSKKESKNETVLKNLLNFEPEEKIPQKKVTTDVKKLIEFENKRLSASKLEKELPRSEEIQSDKKLNDVSRISIMVNKAELDASKGPVRELDILSANKTPLVAKEIVEQLVKKAELLLKLNSSEMKIQLKPEYLGKMTIKVAIDEGTLTARFITESHQVKQTLESNLTNLRQALESQGIRVEKTEVSVQLNNGGMFDGSEGNQQEIWQENRNWFYHGRDSNSGEEPQLSAEIDELEMEEENSYYPQDYGLDANGSMNLLI